MYQSQATSTHWPWIVWDPGWCSENSGSHGQGPIKVFGGSTWTRRRRTWTTTSSFQLNPTFGAYLIYSLDLYQTTLRNLRMLVVSQFQPKKFLYKIEGKLNLEAKQNWRFVKLHGWQRRLESLPVLRWRYVWSFLRVKELLSTFHTGWNNYERRRRCYSWFYHQSFSVPVSSTLFWFSSIMLYQVCNLYLHQFMRWWALDI